MLIKLNDELIVSEFDELFLSVFLLLLLLFKILVYMCECWLIVVSGILCLLLKCVLGLFIKFLVYFN